MQVKLYKVGERLPHAKVAVPYPADFDFDAHTIEPPPMQKSTPLSTIRNTFNVLTESENMKSGLLTEMARAAAEAKDVEVPDIALCVTSPEIYEALKPVCFVLTSAVVFERARLTKLAQPAMSLAGGLEFVKTGLRTRSGITIPDAIIAAMILCKPIPFAAVTTPTLRAFSTGQRDLSTKSSPLTAFGGKVHPFLDAAGFLGQQGEVFLTDLADVIENLVLIADYITPATASPGSNLADHLRSHVNYIRTNVSPAFKLNCWIRWSLLRVLEMIGSGKRFSIIAHDTFFSTIETQDLQQVGDKRPSVEADHRAPRPPPVVPRAQRPDTTQHTQRPAFFAAPFTAPDVSNASLHAAPHWSMPAPQMPPNAAPPMPLISTQTPHWPSFHYQPQYPLNVQQQLQHPAQYQHQQPNVHYQQQQPNATYQQQQPNAHYQQQQSLASGSNTIAVPAGSGQQHFQGNRDGPVVCPVCRAQHIYRDCTAKVNSTGRSFFARCVKDGAGNASLVVANDPSKRICIYYNLYGTCRGHKGDQLHVCSACGSREPGHTLRGNHWPL
ncbi:hypothetical protein B0H16DRAFT_1737732 [Mycena metata]|uniref:Uncharacterized protein n=1 Tax=Mycena metata TaxID=1033252 RepID=A0AAD7ML26_9AGAR|nr:hypothetical protein B0H16DRAFT_1737732 [Mycena metata]